MYRPTVSDIRLRVSNWIRGGLPIPRPRFITAVAGAPHVDHYLKSGQATLRVIDDMLRRKGFDPATLGDVLDFGCGCGRVMRHRRASTRLRLHGTDYNPRLVAWCKRHYPFARFESNELGGRLPYADASFDFIYAWSVFTHLSVPLCEHWVAQLARGLRAGGLLLATFHGEFYAYLLSAEDLARFRAGEVVVHRDAQSGANTCAAFHNETAVRRQFGSRFDIIDIRAGDADSGGQDVYLMRKR